MLIGCLLETIVINQETISSIVGTAVSPPQLLQYMIPNANDYELWLEHTSQLIKAIAYISMQALHQWVPGAAGCFGILRNLLDVLVLDASGERSIDSTTTFYPPQFTMPYLHLSTLPSPLPSPHYIILFHPQKLSNQFTVSPLSQPKSLLILLILTKSAIKLPPRNFISKFAHTISYLVMRFFVPRQLPPLQVFSSNSHLPLHLPHHVPLYTNIL